MSAETNLQTLLANLKPQLLPEKYVFCSLADGQYGDYSEASPIASFIEKEGLTLVVKKAAAKQFDLAYEGVFCCISLSVHSSLDAVGLTAALSNALSKNQISANIIAGYYHDHIFVPFQQAQQALFTIKELAK